jgi:hypothetical protein
MSGTYVPAGAPYPRPYIKRVDQGRTTHPSTPMRGLQRFKSILAKMPFSSRPPGDPASPSPFPLTEDVIYHIVQACTELSPQYSRNTVLACALVSRAWLHPARKVLHQDIAIGTFGHDGKPRSRPPPQLDAVILPHLARLVLDLQTGTEACSALYEHLEWLAPHTTGVLTALWLIAPSMLGEWTPVDILPEPTRIAITPVLAHITHLELQMTEFCFATGTAIQACLHTFPALDTCRIAIEWSRVPASELVGTLAPGALHLRTLANDGDDEYTGYALGLAGAPSVPTLRHLEANFAALSIAPLAAFITTAQALVTLSLHLNVSSWQPSDTPSQLQVRPLETPPENAVPRDFVARHVLASTSLSTLHLRVPWMLANMAAAVLEHARLPALRVLDMQLLFHGTSVEDVPGNMFAGVHMDRFSALESAEIFLEGIPYTKRNAATRQEQHIIKLLAPFWAKEHPGRLVVIMSLEGSPMIGQWDVDHKMSA